MPLATSVGRRLCLLVALIDHMDAGKRQTSDLRVRLCSVLTALRRLSLMGAMACSFRLASCAQALAGGGFRAGRCGGLLRAVHWEPRQGDAAARRGPAPRAAVHGCGASGRGGAGAAGLWSVLSRVAHAMWLLLERAQELPCPSSAEIAEWGDMRRIIVTCMAYEQRTLDVRCWQPNELRIGRDGNMTADTHVVMPSGAGTPVHAEGKAVPTVNLRCGL